MSEPKFEKQKVDSLESSFLTISKNPQVLDTLKNDLKQAIADIEKKEEEAKKKEKMYRYSPPPPPIRSRSGIRNALLGLGALSAVGAWFLNHDESEGAKKTTPQITQLDDKGLDSTKGSHHENSKAYFFSLANTYYDKNKFDLAIENYSKAIELDANYTEGYIRRGISYYNIKEFNKAFYDFNKALRLDPKNTFALENLSKVKAKLQENSKQPSSGKEKIKKEREGIESSDTVDNYINRGDENLKNGEISLAIENFNKAIQLNPEFAAAYTFRSKAYSQIGKYEKAFEDNDKALELEPNYPFAIYQRGYLYLQIEKYELAVENFNKCIERNAIFTDIYLYRSRAFIGIGKLDKALEDINKAIELKTNDPFGIYHRGYIYLKLHKYEKAIQDFDKAIQLDPENLKYQQDKEYALMLQQRSKVVNTKKKTPKKSKNDYFILGD
jgi:tetratricopeptide (TPR) repeat protein